MKTLSLSRRRPARPWPILALLAGAAATTPALAAPAAAQEPAPVTVTNSTRQPVPVTSAAPEIEQNIAQFSISSGDHFGTDDLNTVPAGKVLVFDHVSARATCEPGQTAFLEVRIENPDNTYSGVFRIPPSNLGAFPTYPGAPPKQQLIFGQAISSYVKAGGEFRFAAFRSATAGVCVFFLSYSAHYIDAP